MSKEKDDDIVRLFRPSMLMHKPPRINFEVDQQLVLTRIIREISSETSRDLTEALQHPRIQKILADEFCMTDKEVKELEQKIISYCQTVVERAHVPEDLQATSRMIVQPVQGKQQPLTLLQRKELERYNELDYCQYPAQPCVRSLYYISKIAQTQQIKIVVPPTILIGFGDDNRLVSNNPQTGFLEVKPGYISPKIILAFINKHMVSQHLVQTIEERLTYPKFVIKLASKSSTKNEIKLYYSTEALMADLQNYWGAIDMAIQIFLKQRHMRGTIQRYYLKNNNVYKAVCITNQENLNKNSKLYKNMLAQVQEVHIKSFPPKSRVRPKSCLQRRDGIMMQGQQKADIIKLFPKNLGFDKFKTEDSVGKDSSGFPLTLQGYKLEDLYSLYQTNFPNSDFQKAFCVSTDNIDNLTLMNYRPGANPQAEKMTQDLYRLFTQYYLQTTKFGNISHFVCDFMEDENGLVYLLQIKSFECEGITHPWQQRMPSRKSRRANQTDKSLTESEETMSAKCKAAIICGNSMYFEVKAWLQEACTSLDLWTFNHRQGCTPKQSVLTIRKYQKELQLGKDHFLREREKQKICPLTPLTSFPDQHHQQQLKVYENQLQDEAEEQVSCCHHCFKLLELYTQRYYSLIFKTEITSEELRKLKSKPVDQWTQDNIVFLLMAYKDAKRTLNQAHSQEFYKREARSKQIFERSKTPSNLQSALSRLTPLTKARSQQRIALQTAATSHRDKTHNLKQTRHSVDLAQTNQKASETISTITGKSSPMKKSASACRVSSSKKSPRDFKLLRKSVIYSSYALIQEAIAGAEQTLHGSSGTKSMRNLNNLELHQTSTPSLANLDIPPSTGQQSIKFSNNQKAVVNDLELQKLARKYNLKLEIKGSTTVEHSRNQHELSKNSSKPYKSYILSAQNELTPANQEAPPSQTLMSIRKHLFRNGASSIKICEYFNKKRSIRKSPKRKPVRVGGNPQFVNGQLSERQQYLV